MQAWAGRVPQARLAADPLPYALHRTQVLLGTRTLEYEMITTAALEPPANGNGLLPWRTVSDALESGGLRMLTEVRWCGRRRLCRLGGWCWWRRRRWRWAAWTERQP